MINDHGKAYFSKAYMHLLKYKTSNDQAAMLIVGSMKELAPLNVGHPCLVMETVTFTNSVVSLDMRSATICWYLLNTSSIIPSSKWLTSNGSTALISLATLYPLYEHLMGRTHREFTWETSSLFMVKDPSFPTSHFTSVGDGV